MEKRAQTEATWSFLLPAVALVATWFGYRLAYPSDSFRTLAALSAMDAAGAVGGLVLVSRSKPCRGWAAAGAVASVLAVLVAIATALLAALMWSLSSLTF